MRDAAGIAPVPGQRRQRIHDLRHTFTVATLLDWYRAGVDVQVRLPLLSLAAARLEDAFTAESEAQP